MLDTQKTHHTSSSRASYVCLLWIFVRKFNGLEWCLAKRYISSIKKSIIACSTNRFWHKVTLYDNRKLRYYIKRHTLLMVSRHRWYIFVLPILAARHHCGFGMCVIIWSFRWPTVMVQVVGIIPCERQEYVYPAWLIQSLLIPWPY